MKKNADLQKRNIIRCFDRAAKTYDSHADLQHRIGLQLLDYMLEVKRNAFQIADVGSGTGLLTQRLQQKFPAAKLYGVDLSPNMLTTCQQQFPEASMKLVCADFDALPFPSNSLDLIYSNMTLQWSLNLAVTFSELIRCLAPGGILAFSLFVDDTLENFRPLLNINRFYQSTGLKTMLANQPVSLLKLGTEIFYQEYAKPYELIHFFKQTGANYTLDRNKNGYLTSKYRQEIFTDFESKQVGSFKVANGIVRKIT